MPFLFDKHSEGGERFQRWLKFHRENPKVWKLFQYFAWEAWGVRERFGARMIWERMRWYTQVETTDCDYKLNDHYPPYYARLLAWTFEEFDSFFELRGDSDVDRETFLRLVNQPAKGNDDE